VIGFDDTAARGQHKQYFLTYITKTSEYG